MKRPRFGQHIRARDRIKRIEIYRDNSERFGKVWRRVGELTGNPEPVEGLYAGFRAGSDGERDWERDVGFFYIRHTPREYWLVIPGPRRNPVRVFPEDVEPWEERD